MLQGRHKVFCEGWVWEKWLDITVTKACFKRTTWIQLCHTCTHTWDTSKHLVSLVMPLKHSGASLPRINHCLYRWKGLATWLLMFKIWAERVTCSRMCLSSPSSKPYLPFCQTSLCQKVGQTPIRWNGRLFLFDLNYVISLHPTKKAGSAECLKPALPTHLTLPVGMQSSKRCQNPACKSHRWHLSSVSSEEMVNLSHP